MDVSHHWGSLPRESLEVIPWPAFSSESYPYPSFPLSKNTLLRGQHQLIVLLLLIRHGIINTKIKFSTNTCKPENHSIFKVRFSVTLTIPCKYDLISDPSYWSRKLATQLLYINIANLEKFKVWLLTWFIVWHTEWLASWPDWICGRNEKRTDKHTYAWNSWII